MLEKLFESLDEKVFTAELKESMLAQFNEAVEAKAEEIAAARIEEEIETLSEKSEAHIEFLNEKAEEFLEQQKEEMVEAVDAYLDRVVNEFLTEAKASLDESVKNEKADMIIEAFDAMLVATGVQVARIVEAKDDSSVQSKLDETVKKYDALVNENIALQEENDNLIKVGVINELKEGLSIVQAKKFEKLAELVEFTKDEAYLEKLNVIKENVQGSSEAESSKEDETIEESVDTSSWAHLV